MVPKYNEKEEQLEVKNRPTLHYPPHMHPSLELVVLLKGSYTLGCGIDMFQMNEGDIGIIFPSLIHHFQNFSGEKGEALHLSIPPAYLGAFTDMLTTKRPYNPVVPKKNIHPDIPYVIERIQEILSSPDRPEEKTEEFVVENALLYSYVQIILARIIPELVLYDRGNTKDQDPVYQTVSYIAAHFQEDLSLSSVAQAIGISKFQLSRIFSTTFHQNFNFYLNEVRLTYAVSMLRDTSRPITEIAFEAGFQSQATFNRVFANRYHTSPRNYRKIIQGEK